MSSNHRCELPRAVNKFVGCHVLSVVKILQLVHNLKIFPHLLFKANFWESTKFYILKNNSPYHKPNCESACMHVCVQYTCVYVYHTCVRARVCYCVYVCAYTHVRAWVCLWNVCMLFIAYVSVQTHTHTWTHKHMMQTLCICGMHVCSLVHDEVINLYNHLFICLSVRNYVITFLCM